KPIPCVGAKNGAGPGAAGQYWRRWSWWDGSRARTGCRRRQPDRAGGAGWGAARARPCDSNAAQPAPPSSHISLRYSEPPKLSLKQNLTLNEFFLIPGTVETACSTANVQRVPLRLGQAAGPTVNTDKNVLGVGKADEDRELTVEDPHVCSFTHE